MCNQTLISNINFMQKPIIALLFFSLLASCAKKNQPVPAKPFNCVVRSFRYNGAFANEEHFAKIFSTYRRNKYEMDSIVETDSKGTFLNTIIKRKFDESNNLIGEDLIDKKYVYTVRNNKCIRTQELSLEDDLLREFDYEYDKRFLTKIVVSEGDKKDTIQLFYPHDYGQIIIRPIKITRNGGKTRYYREYDFYNNLIKESSAEYSHTNSSDSLEKQTVIYTKTFDIFSVNNFTIQKYILGDEFGNMLHTKFHGVFHIGTGIYIPRMDDAYNTNWESDMVLNEQNQLKSFTGGLYGFYNISEFKYTCE